MQILLIRFLKGMAMGAADVVPGVSGGTIAFMLGIYERLLRAIKSIDKAALGMLFNLRLSVFWARIDGKFLLPVLLGIATSILSLAKLFKFLLSDYPVLTMSFFFGLIAATVWAVGRQVSRWYGGTVFSFLIGVSLAVLIAFLGQATENPAYWYVFLCGMLAICSMILPGISGSFVLLLMGNYFLVISALSRLGEALRSFNASVWVDILAVLVPFGLGALLGLFSFSRVLSWAFTHYKNLILALLTGFVLGSLSIIYPWKVPIEISKTVGNELKTKVVGYTYTLPPWDLNLLYALLIMFFAFVLVLFIDKQEQHKNQ
ncbi:MAG: DUF368 domain-containing protein [Bernardetiaceae bacterium]|nr:DUF368 domain-containing protein [Bernardetiaceae bacterium]